MKAVAKRDLINDVAFKWRRQYYHIWDKDKDKEKIYNQLCRLKNPTEKQVCDIIGNNSWTSNKCTECGKDVAITIQVGEEPDYESATAWLCSECLQEAINLIEEGVKNAG
jgi:hypothetical protein